MGDLLDPDHSIAIVSMITPYEPIILSTSYNERQQRADIGAYVLRHKNVPEKSSANTYGFGKGWKYEPFQYAVR